MELIERYLQAVKFALPQPQRDDIIKELRDNILSQVEEKEAELGHPLGEDEQAELLKKLGSPMQLASRYRKQQPMIGATMFPIYWKVLKASLGLAFLVLVAAQHRHRSRRQNSHGESGRAVPLSQRRVDDIRLDHSDLLRSGVLRRQAAFEGQLGPAQAAAAGKAQPAQVEFRVDHATPAANHIRGVVAGRVALSVPHIRPGHCLPPFCPGVAIDLSPVCGDGAGRCSDHCGYADLAAMGPGQRACRGWS